MKAIQKLLHHHKYSLIGVIVLLVLGCALTVYAFVQNDADHKAKTSTGRQPVGRATEFVMVGTPGLPFRATVQTGTSGVTTLVDRDDKGITRITQMVNGKLTARVYSGEVTYSCNTTACNKIHLDDNTEQLAYDFTSDAVQRLKLRVAYVGEADCPAGSCLVWEAAPDDTAVLRYSQTLYVDKRTKSASKVVRTYANTGVTETITYDYRPQIITVPPVPQDIPEL